ncbi:3-methyl-2-oxobutanoate hydroxymethyltransferase [Alkalicoccus chagannorensis]|uniref:3-methyl-2-oxobutanoate hydroxymethyltransferase n=1 Tax=Alkalicoccus chagannorensis TaxID=427072 RepID=UPI00047C9B80|nr:3-methyl-2-oxobutanoate hydroxymethyltransferase [Alkalicoccus chagannorensis]
MKHTTTSLKKMKQEKDPIVMMTAYDAPGAGAAEKAGADVILVGDSLGMTVLGFDSTVHVTIPHMTHHGSAVKRGAAETFIVIDMPFMASRISSADTKKAALQLMQQGGADAVKMEGAGPLVQETAELTAGGIPVVAHLGLTPQTVGVEGGYKVQGKTPEAQKQLLEDAEALERAGACMLVLECVPEETAKLASEQLQIPVIGIGAGRWTDGQVLVYHDIIGMYQGHQPKFVRQFSDAGAVAEEGLAAYKEAVKKREFPQEAHAFQPLKETY